MLRQLSESIIVATIQRFYQLLNAADDEGTTIAKSTGQAGLFVNFPPESNWVHAHERSRYTSAKDIILGKTKFNSLAYSWLIKPYCVSISEEAGHRVGVIRRGLIPLHGQLCSPEKLLAG